MTTFARDLYSGRELLWAWTSRNLRARYQQSVLGWLWAIVQPVAQVAIFSIIFTRIVPVDTGGVPYVIFSYVAVTPWTLLSSSLSDMAMALINNMSLVNKIYFPREILVLSAMLARFMDFLISAVLLVVLMIIYQTPVSPATLVYLPVILLVQILLMVGLGLGLSAANVFYRDVQSLLALGLQLWFYASPILYPVSAVPEQLRTLYFLNPMAGILESYRDVLLEGAAPGNYLWIAAAVSAIIFVAGYAFFKRVEFRFADIV